MLPSGPMRMIPIDQGPRGRRRVGPFWIEEGLGVVGLGAVLLAAVVALYILALIYRPR